MGSKRQLTGAALTAKVIKKRLTTLYPQVKFSVRSDVFSMGNSIDIRWTDGPMQKSVEAVTGQYQRGSFNCMTDMYEHVGINPSLGCEGAKYVECHRTISSGYMAAIVEKAKGRYGILDPNDYGYYRKLADIEMEFFAYPEAEHMKEGTA